MDGELKATIDDEQRCNVLFRTGHYPSEASPLGRLNTGLPDRDPQWYQGFNQFIASLRGYRLHSSS